MYLEKLSPIKITERTMGFKETFGLWVAANVVITTVLTGMLFAQQISFYECLFAITLGSLIGSIPLALTAKMGFRTGLPTMVVAKAAFGEKGAVLPAIANVFMLIGWSWIQAYLAGLSLNYAINYLTGYSNINLFVILTELVVIGITIKGHRIIATLERIIANIMLILSFLIFTIMFIHYDVQNIITLQIVENPQITVLVAFDIVIATAFSWMSSVCDYNRYCKTEKSSMLGTYFGYTLATVIAMTLGFVVAAFSVSSAKEITYDPAILLTESGLGGYALVAAIVVFFSVVSTNVMALYSATFSFMSIKKNIDFKLTLSIIGVIVTLGALLKESLMTNFFDFILLVSTIYIPIFAIILSDYFIVKSQNYDCDEILTNKNKVYHYQSGFNICAIVTYLISATFGYFFTYSYPLAIGSAIPTFIFSAILYILLMRLGKKMKNGVNDVK